MPCNAGLRERTSNSTVLDRDLGSSPVPERELDLGKAPDLQHLQDLDLELGLSGSNTNLDGLDGLDHPDLEMGWGAARGEGEGASHTTLQGTSLDYRPKSLLDPGDYSPKSVVPSDPSMLPSMNAEQARIPTRTHT